MLQLGHVHGCAGVPALVAGGRGLAHAHVNGGADAKCSRAKFCVACMACTACLCVLCLYVCFWFCDPVVCIFVLCDAYSLDQCKG